LLQNKSLTNDHGESSVIVPDAIIKVSKHCHGIGLFVDYSYIIRRSYVCYTNNLHIIYE